MCAGLVANVAASVLTTAGTGSAPAVTPAGSSSWADFGGFSPALAARSVLPCKPGRRPLRAGPVPSQLALKTLQVTHGFTNAQGSGDQAAQGAAGVRSHL